MNLIREEIDPGYALNLWSAFIHKELRGILCTCTVKEAYRYPTHKDSSVSVMRFNMVRNECVLHHVNTYHVIVATDERFYCDLIAQNYDIPLYEFSVENVWVNKNTLHVCMKLQKGWKEVPSPLPLRWSWTHEIPLKDFGIVCHDASSIESHTQCVEGHPVTPDDAHHGWNSDLDCEDYHLYG